MAGVLAAVHAWNRKCKDCFAEKIPRASSCCFLYKCASSLTPAAGRRSVIGVTRARVTNPPKHRVLHIRNPRERGWERERERGRAIARGPIGPDRRNSSCTHWTDTRSTRRAGTTGEAPGSLPSTVSKVISTCATQPGIFITQTWGAQRVAMRRASTSGPAAAAAHRPCVRMQAHGLGDLAPNASDPLQLALRRRGWACSSSLLLATVKPLRWPRRAWRRRTRALIRLERLIRAARLSRLTLLRPVSERLGGCVVEEVCRVVPFSLAARRSSTHPPAAPRRAAHAKELRQCHVRRAAARCFP